MTLQILSFPGIVSATNGHIETQQKTWIDRQITLLAGFLQNVYKFLR